MLGGSVAGLLAARVLADHAAEVVVLERDRDADDGERRGVPQRLQVHALLPGGRAQIERWFPGFGREAVEQGALASGPHQSEQWIDDVRAVSAANVILLTPAARSLKRCCAAAPWRCRTCGCYRKRRRACAIATDA